MNCPNCGKKAEVSTQDLLIALMVECGVRTNHDFDYCHCPPATKPPKFISGNWLTESRAEAKGDVWVDIWRKHNEPNMRDCRDLKYKYAIGSKGDIIVMACGDYYNINNEFEEVS